MYTNSFYGFNWLESARGPKQIVDVLFANVINLALYLGGLMQTKLKIK